MRPQDYIYHIRENEHNLTADCTRHALWVYLLIDRRKRSTWSMIEIRKIIFNLLFVYYALCERTLYDENNHGSYRKLMGQTIFNENHPFHSVSQSNYLSKGKTFFPTSVSLIFTLTLALEFSIYLRRG